MGTISSGTGLISGLDIQGIVSKLMQIEARPRDLLNNRIKVLTSQQTTLMSLQARVMAVQIAAASFNKQSGFQQKTAKSSDESVLTATADRFAVPGSYTFRVKRLASSDHLVSRGYASLDSGLGAGTISVEIGNGQLARPTELSFLNGQTGFRRGAITVTDRAGHTAQIDLSAVLTVSDVLKAINDNTAVSVRASVQGDSLVITDASGGTGTLAVSGAPAESLGIAGTASPADPTRIVGTDVLYLTADTLLKQLNDGNGVRGLGFGNDLIFRRDGTELFAVDLRDKLAEVVNLPDASNTLASLNGGQGVRLGKFRITDQNGRYVDIDLNELAAKPELQGKPITLGHLKDFLAEKVAARNQELNPGNDPNFVGMSLAVSFSGADHLTLTDASLPNAGTAGSRLSHFIIADLDGGLAAKDLGIAADVAGSTVNGQRIWRMNTLGDALNAINNHYANYDQTLSGDDKRLVVAQLDAAGTGLQITYRGAGALSLDATDAAEDLGVVNAGFLGSLTGRRLIAGLNTVLLRSLNGGSAGDRRITAGNALALTDRAGHTAALDLSAAQTVQDVLDALNNPALGLNLTAALNPVGNGLLITDATAPDQIVGNLVIADADAGTLAQNLGIAVNAAVSQVNSGNLQLQYVSEATALADLRQGQGIRLGRINLTSSSGNRFTVDLARDNIKTVRDVIDEINRQSVQMGYDAENNPIYYNPFHASINDTGDGLLIEEVLQDDHGNPVTTTGQLQISDVSGGYTARDLGLLAPVQKTADGRFYVDGSYEYKINVGGGDTIEDFAGSLNDAGIGVSVSVVNDGGPNNPYRISFTSQLTGRRGLIYLDPGQTNLAVQTLTDAQDALVLFGDGPEENALMVSASSNTLTNVLKDTTIELHAVSSAPVQLDIAADIDGVAAQLKAFVDAFNAALKDLAAADKFNPDTQERSILFADRTVGSIRNALLSLVNHTVPGASARFNRLASVGVTLAPLQMQSALDESGQQRSFAVAGTPQLQFDEQDFRDAYAENPEAVTDLFTRTQAGLGDYVANRLENLAGASDSTVKSRLDAMTAQQNGFQQRVAQLDDLLDRKEQRLYNQFNAMEQALASLQSQQSALASLVSLASSASIS